MSASDLLVVAGEASGDLHAARLLSALLALRPDLRPFGLGGDELAAAGCELLGHSSEIAVVGITEVLKVLPRARELFDRLLADVDRRGARTAILVDFPDFNLRLARRLADRGVKVVYYVSPQVWAWRRGRLRTMAQKVDLMLVLFPFEVEAYRQHRVPVRHVGHPLVDEVPEVPQVWDLALHGPRAAAAAGPDDGSGRPAAYTVALLPGSRRSEVRALLPAMLAAVVEIAKSQPVQARLIQSANVPTSLFGELLGDPNWLAAGVPLEIVPQSERFAGVAGSHLALCASGTATLEVGLLRTPLIVLYRLTRWSAALARLLVRLSHWSLVNLVLGDGVVPELFQEEVEPQRVAAEAVALLTDAARRNRMRASLAELRPRLGSRGASARAATAVAAVLPPPGGR